MREICMNWWWNCVKKSHRLKSTLNHRRVTVTHISFSIIFTRRYNLRYNLISMKIAQKPSLKLQLRSEDEFPHSTWVSIKFNNHRSMQVDFLLQIFNILNDWKQSVHHLNDNCGWFFVWVWSRYHNSVYCVIVLSVWIDNPIERVVSFIWTSSEHRSHPSFIDMSLLPSKVQNAWHAPLLVIDRNCCSSDNWIFTQTCHSSFFLGPIVLLVISAYVNQQVRMLSSAGNLSTRFQKSESTITRIATGVRVAKNSLLSESSEESVDDFNS